jgi:hypothetical protein
VAHGEDSPDGKPAQREHGGAVPGAATLAVRSDLLDPDAPRSVAVDNFEIYWLLGISVSAEVSGVDLRFDRRQQGCAP